jgi:hypothetical protein
MALLTYPEYKVFAHLTNDNAQTRLQAIIDAVEKYFLNRIDRAIKEDSYTEIRDGDGTNKLMLNQWPVTAISLVKLIDINNVETTIDATDYWFYESGKLELKFSCFYNLPQSAHIEYTAGFATVPDDIKMLIAEIVLRKYEEFDKGKGGTVDSESFIGGSIVIRDSDVTDTGNIIINHYKKKGKFN